MGSQGNDEQLWLPLYDAECIVTPKEGVAPEDLVATLTTKGIAAYRNGVGVIARFPYHSRRSFSNAVEGIFHTPGVEKLIYTPDTQTTYEWLARQERRWEMERNAAFRNAPLAPWDDSIDAYRYH